jgi:hypothetical protein
MTQLDTLIQEVIDFSDVIACNENPADPDLQNACRLFSEYLDFQLKQARRDFIGTPAKRHNRWHANELRLLSDLIQRPTHSPTCCITWIRTLMQYCITLQRGKLAA